MTIMVGPTAAAKHLFMSKQRFHQLMLRGIVPRSDENGLVDLDEARRSYIMWMRGLMTSVNSYKSISASQEWRRKRRESLFT